MPARKNQPLPPTRVRMQIALAANVSAMTVTRYLRGDRATVPALANAIDKAMRDLGLPARDEVRP